MTLDELIVKLRNIAKTIDVSGVDFLAVQVNIKDADPGVLYVEIKNHNVSVEPYDYHDKSCGITISMDNFNKLLDGKLDAVKAFLTGKLHVDGSVDKALEFSNLLKNR